MKRYRILLILIATLSFTSCLKENPKDQLDEDAIYGSASEIYTNAVASLYNYIGGANESEGIQGTCRGIYDYNTLTTDEAIIPIRGGDWYDGGLWNAMYQHKWTADDESLYDTWKYVYKVIVLANKSLDIIDAKSSLLTTNQKDQFKAEVRAVRALIITRRWICLVVSPWCCRRKRRQSIPPLQVLRNHHRQIRSLLRVFR